ncbi:MAG TPA: acyltransferase family protein [Candidatus Avipropionibacterium avicola]|uniref:Acyltransferase family protein n=1 Tax=Candidatus Avipropionibacterium avicola TaxID=2840701 RepID=A0A9D1GYR4_9ACTN|nr:acyltransferase family protein [Candidatus Avipropionibacterium avicola]
MTGPDTSRLGERGQAFVAQLLELGRHLGAQWSMGLDQLGDYARDRLSGDYPVDEFGHDPEFTETVWLPVARALALNWFRCETRGSERLPADGPVMLVANHAGSLPLDGLVLQAMVREEIGRWPRMLGADLVFRTPFVGTFARRIGTTLACQPDAARLLAAGNMVSVFPEGFKGLGKRYAHRYKLQRFGRGGFVATAIAAGVPIVPVSIVGSEEIYPNLADVPFLARALGLPYFPLTPTFPWLGPLGAVPLPSKWLIGFGTPIRTDQLEPGAAEDPMTVFGVTDQVRESIQHSLYALLAERGPAFRTDR